MNSDLISRQDALKALSNMMDTEGFREGWAVSRANVKFMLEYMPSAEPERKKGRWLMNGERYGHMYWRCSQCGEEVDYIGANFCSNCGSYNGGEEDG